MNLFTQGYMAKRSRPLSRPVPQGIALIIVRACSSHKVVFATTSTSAASLSSSPCTLSEYDEKIPDRTRILIGGIAKISAFGDPIAPSTFAKGKEFLAFASGCLITYARDVPYRHKSVSQEGRFAHYIVKPWYDWFGCNERAVTSPALDIITLQPCHRQPEGPMINAGGFNYAGTYGLSAECETQHRTCLENLPVSGAASPLIEQALERALCDFWSVDCCFTTPTGYQSNMLAMTAILTDSWFVLLDQKSHSSMTTAAYLANAGGRRKFKHNDMYDLERLLREVEGQCPNIMVAVEGLYSLDGDIPDLAALQSLKARYNFVLYCDEAHSFLSLGKTGRGCLEWWNDRCPHDPVAANLIDIRSTTLSKAVGAIGGLVCASECFAAVLRSQAISLRATGESLATPAMLQALCILHQPERLKHNLARLRRMSEYCHQELEGAGVIVYGERTSPILPVYAGRPTKASELSYVLRKHGIAATPFSKPAVPMWESRVRIGLSAEFSDEQVNQLIKGLVNSCGQVGLIHSSRPTLTCGRAREPSVGFRSELSYSKLEVGKSDAISFLDELIQAQIDQRKALRVPDIHTDHPQSCSIVEAGHRARVEYGLGSGSSRWILGTYPPHLEVEKFVCDMTHQPAAMPYTNTEVGLMSTVAALHRSIRGSSNHWILVPKVAQQPVLDGCRVAPRNKRTIRIDYGDLKDLVKTVASLTEERGKGYVTLILNAEHLSFLTSDDHVGFRDRLSALRAKLNGITILLDASSDSPTPQPIDSRLTLNLVSLAASLHASVLVFGSFFHTLGLNGAYLVGDMALIDELRYTSRCYVFTAAPGPYMMGMVAEALKQRRANDVAGIS